MSQGKYHFEVLLFLFLFLSFAYFLHTPRLDNENSRFDLVYAIVNDGTFRIDDYHRNTVDKSFYKGHFYSDKAPGTSFLGVPVYWTIRQLQKIIGSNLSERMVRYLVRVLSVSLISALAGVLFFKSLFVFFGNKEQSLLLTLVYFFGTAAFSYSTLFYGHQLGASFIIVSFYLLVCRSELRATDLLKAGFLAGYGMISEYPTIIYAVGMFIYLSKWKNKWLFLLGLAFPVGALLMYNQLSFGHPLTLSYSYAYLAGFRAQYQGLTMGIELPKLRGLYLFLLSSNRGLFSLSPFLLLAFPGFISFFRVKKYRREFWLSLLVSLSYILVISGHRTWKEAGGWAFGPRSITPILPFLILPVGFFLKKTTLLGKVLFLSLSVISLANYLLVNIVDPRIPPVFTYPLSEYIVPLLLQGTYGVNIGTLLGLSSFRGLLPFLILLAGMVVFLIRIKNGFLKELREARGLKLLRSFLIPILLLLLWWNIFFRIEEKTSNKYFLLGHMSNVLGNTEGAQKFLRGAITLDSSNSRPKIVLFRIDMKEAIKLLDSRKFKEARRMAAEAVIVAPENPEPLFLISLSYFQDSPPNLEQAIHFYKAARELGLERVPKYEGILKRGDNRYQPHRSIQTSP